MKVEPLPFMKLKLFPAAILSLALSSYAQTAADSLPQAPTPNLPVTQLAGGVTVEHATPGSVPLSIDDAIARGLQHNLGIVLDLQNQRLVHGQVLTVENNLLPTMTVTARTSTQPTNLAALGFKPQNIHIPGFTGTFPTIVKVDVTAAQFNLTQQLFNVPAYYLY